MRRQIPLKMHLFSVTIEDCGSVVDSYDAQTSFTSHVVIQPVEMLRFSSGTSEARSKVSYILSGTSEARSNVFFWNDRREFDDRRESPSLSEVPTEGRLAERYRGRNFFWT
jgi:hypothetical protein